MQVCFSWIILIVAAIFAMVSLLRWFEMTSDAVDSSEWSRLMLLVLAPFSVWLYKSKVAAGRPVMPPRHEPVRGFGGLPKGGIQAPSEAPPGTPPEFLGMPKIPPKKAARAVDPEKLAKLKQKMKEQGMLEDDGVDG